MRFRIFVLFVPVICRLASSSGGLFFYTILGQRKRVKPMYDNEYILDDDLFQVEESVSKDQEKESGDKYYPRSQIKPDAVCILPQRH